VTAMLKITDDIRAQLDKGNVTFLTLLNYSKAFDTVNQSILCAKLANIFNFTLPAARLLRTYLSNRHRHTV